MASRALLGPADAPPVSLLDVSAGAGVPLRLAGIHKRWRKDQPPVLCGLDLALQQGTTTWIDGRNGAGKTTLMRIASGLILPDDGGVSLWGIAPQENWQRYQRLVSFLPAGDRGLYARLTVRRQLEFWGRITMLEREGFRDQLERAIRTFDLEDLVDRRVDRMSMGQRQRLRLAMTFLGDPEVVLLDEPLTSLDSEGAEMLVESVRQVIRRDGAVLWCSPSGESIPIDTDRHLRLQDGRLVAE